jgi:hypothetical protein
MQLGAVAGAAVDLALLASAAHDQGRDDQRGPSRIHRSWSVGGRGEGGHNGRPADGADTEVRRPQQRSASGGSARAGVSGDRPAPLGREYRVEDRGTALTIRPQGSRRAEWRPCTSTARQGHLGHLRDDGAVQWQRSSRGGPLRPVHQVRIIQSGSGLRLDGHAGGGSTPSAPPDRTALRAALPTSTRTCQGPGRRVCATVGGGPSAMRIVVTGPPATWARSSCPSCSTPRT